MKIAVVNQPLDGVLPPNQNSIGIWTYEVARRLSQSCDVIVYTGQHHSGKRVECVDGIHCRRMLLRPDQWMQKLLRRLFIFRDVKRPLFASLWYYLGYILQVANDLRLQQCDIVHIHNYSQFVFIIRALNPRIKIVLHMHCEWLTQLNHAMIERRLQKVNSIISCCEYITEKIGRCFIQFADRCQTVHNAVDVEHFVPNNNRSKTGTDDVRRLLFVGRVSPEKGVHVLIDAFERVLRYYPRAHLEIVGPQKAAPMEFIISLSDDAIVSNLASFYQGSYLSHLQGKLAPTVASHVSFAGSVSHWQLIDHFWRADIFLHPSVWGEPFPLAVLEAMAAGVPVVGTRVGGLPECIEDGKTGLLVEQGNANALAKAALRLLENEDLMDSMGKAGRKRAVQLFSWERIVEQLLGLYRSICE